MTALPDVAHTGRCNVYLVYLSYYWPQAAIMREERIVKEFGGHMQSLSMRPSTPSFRGFCAVCPPCKPSSPSCSHAILLSPQTYAVESLT